MAHQRAMMGLAKRMEANRDTPAGDAPPPVMNGNGRRVRGTPAARGAAMRRAGTPCASRRVGATS